MQCACWLAKRDNKQPEKTREALTERRNRERDSDDEPPTPAPRVMPVDSSSSSSDDHEVQRPTTVVVNVSGGGSGGYGNETLYLERPRQAQYGTLARPGLSTAGLAPQQGTLRRVYVPPEPDQDLPRAPPEPRSQRRPQKGLSSRTGRTVRNNDTPPEPDDEGTLLRRGPPVAAYDDDFQDAPEGTILRRNVQNY